MNSILAFLVGHMEFLWNGARFRITTSGVSASFGDAFLVVESKYLALVFSSERSRLLLDLQPAGSTDDTDRFAIYFVVRWLTGQSLSRPLDGGHAEFLRHNIAELESGFSPHNWAATKRDLQKVQQQAFDERG